MVIIIKLKTILLCSTVKLIIPHCFIDNPHLLYCIALWITQLDCQCQVKISSFFEGHVIIMHQLEPCGDPHKLYKIINNMLNNHYNCSFQYSLHFILEKNKDKQVLTEVKSQRSDNNTVGRTPLSWTPEGNENLTVWERRVQHNRIGILF